LLRQPPIPVSVLTGFLGSGKTTLIRSLLRDPAFAGTAVVVNEFGEIGLDHLLVEAAEKEDTILLDGGCLCCATRGDLVRDLPHEDRPRR
jgi:G3E family GTPase